METKAWRWAESIASSALYIFWGIWGAGLGAFGAVFFKAVDVGGDALRIYMAILTVMMGAAVGLITSRGMDSLADRRKRRRKTFSALSRIDAVIRRYTDLQNYFNDDIRARALVMTNDGLTEQEIGATLAHCERLQQSADFMPDFDDIVENETDAQMERLCRNNFVHCQDVYNVKDIGLEDTANLRTKIAIVAMATASPGRSDTGVALKAVASYFRKRLL